MSLKLIQVEPNSVVFQLHPCLWGRNIGRRVVLDFA